MLRTILTGFVVLSMMLVSVAFGADTVLKKDALAAIESWLTIIDKGEYAGS